MKTTIHFGQEEFCINLAEPLDISIPLRSGPSNVNAWYLDPPVIEAHPIGGKPGLVAEGASVNFNDIRFNPHAHGTHTEGVGHICAEVHSVNGSLSKFFFKALLLTLEPQEFREDLVITADQLENALSTGHYEALVLRTLPNSAQKLTRQYSNTNPPYLQEAAAAYLASKSIDHLLVDLPSVDKEKDEGRLAAHKAFWNFGGPLRMHATITEFIYVPDRLVDGLYILELQMAPFENDASPSRPVLYKVAKK